MTNYVVPIATTQVFVLPTTAAYEAVMEWLNAASIVARLQHGIVSIAGQRSQRRITITASAMTTDIDVAVPILPIPV